MTTEPPATDAAGNPRYAAAREAAIDAAMAVFDRHLKLHTPHRHLVVDALDAAADVMDSFEQAETDRLLAGVGFAGIEIGSDEDRVLIRQSADLARSMVLAFDALVRSQGCENYLEQTHTVTDPALEEAIAAGLPPEQWPTHRQYKFIVVKPGGKSPHELRKQAELRTAMALKQVRSLTVQLEQVKAAGIDPGLLRWCSWPDCLHSFNAATGPAGDGRWKTYRHGSVLLCPDHADTEHWPSCDYDPDTKKLIGRCGCGETDVVTPGNWNAVFTWWERHLREPGGPLDPDRDLWEALGHARVRAWFCPRRSEHPKTGGPTVDWRDGVAYCLADDCDLTSDDTLRAHRFFDEHQAPDLTASGVDDEPLAHLRHTYVQNACSNPEALRQLREQYPDARGADRGQP